MASVIHQYNAKVSQIHGSKRLGKPLWPIYYGVELEYEVKTSSSHKSKEDMLILRNKVGEKISPTISTFAFTKHDGSLKNGFEVVTIPMTLESHDKHWNDFFSKAKDNQIEVKPTCGMHVHASREILTPFQIGKMLVFICSPENNIFLYTIAGRKPPANYAEMNPKKIGDVHRHQNRYSALNLANHETVEFRMFKGTMSKDQAMKNLEFCDALIRFTWPSVVGYRDLRSKGVELFCKFVEDSKSVYPHLYEFLCLRNFVKRKPKKKGRPRKTATAQKKSESSLMGFLQNLGSRSECAYDYSDCDYELN